MCRGGQVVLPGAPWRGVAGRSTGPEAVWNAFRNESSRRDARPGGCARRLRARQRAMSGPLQAILIADADRTAASLVHAGLVGNGFRIIEVYDGETALRVIRDERPVLAVLATQLPSRSGLDLVRLIRADAQLGTLPIILVSARADAMDRINGLDLGADDFIAKPFHPREVAARVKALLRRQAIYAEGRSGEVRRAGDLSIDDHEHEARLGGVPLPLTPTEYRLLYALMSQPGRAFSRTELIEQGLGPDFNGKARTLDSHIRNLRAKIERSHARTHKLRTVFGVGYRLIVPPDEPRATNADGAAGH